MATSRSVIATVNHTDARQESRPMSQSNCDLVLARRPLRYLSALLPPDPPEMAKLELRLHVESGLRSNWKGCAVLCPKLSAICSLGAEPRFPKPLVRGA